MEFLTAWSTFANAIFTGLLFIVTTALVIFAGVNYQKFVENVRLVADSVNAQNESLKAQTRSIDLQNKSLKAQVQSIDLQAEGIKEQIKAIELQSKSFEAQTKALELQNKDIYLNYKPVVYIKNVITPTLPDEILDPFKHAFILTNSGKLPAREVMVVAIQNSKSDNITVTNSSMKVLNKASIYPGSDLILWIPRVVSGPNLGNLELKFIITYKGDGIEQEMKEVMKFVNTESTNHKWVYVGPRTNVVNNMPKILIECGVRDVSQGRLNIVTSIIDDIFGLDFVIKAKPTELIEAFSKVSEEIQKNGFDKTHTINGGALTGLRSINIIDKHDQLTMFGVSVFKRVADHLKSSE